MKRKIMIIGTGGIGSFLIPLLDKTKLYRITAFDPDIVEVKNLTYQNFEMREIEEKKVKALQQRYSSMLYRSSVKWLDLRAQGRNGALISYKTPKDMFDVVLTGPDGSFSCQGTEWDGKNEGIHFTHVCIAGMAAEWLQRWYVNNDDVCDYKVVNI